MTEVRSASSGRNYTLRRRNIDNQKKDFEDDFFGLYQTLVVNKIDKPKKQNQKLEFHPQIHELYEDDNFLTQAGLFENDYINDKEYSFVSNEISNAYKKDQSLDENLPYTSSENLTKTEQKGGLTSGRRLIVLEKNTKEKVNELKLNKVNKPQIQIETFLGDNFQQNDSITARKDENIHTPEELLGFTINVDKPESSRMCNKDFDPTDIQSPVCPKYLLRQSAQSLKANNKSSLVIEKKFTLNINKASPKFFERAKSSLTTRFNINIDMLVKGQTKSQRNPGLSAYHTCKNQALPQVESSLSNSSIIDSNTKILIKSKANDIPHLVYQNMNLKIQSRFNNTNSTINLYDQSKKVDRYKVDSLSEGVKGVSLQSKSEINFNHQTTQHKFHKLHAPRKSSLYDNQDKQSFLGKYPNSVQKQLKIANLKINTKLKTQKSLNSYITCKNQNSKETSKPSITWLLSDHSEQSPQKSNQIQEPYQDEETKKIKIKIQNLGNRTNQQFQTMQNSANKLYRVQKSKPKNKVLITKISIKSLKLDLRKNKINLIKPKSSNCIKQIFQKEQQLKDQYVEEMINIQNKKNLNLASQATSSIFGRPGNDKFQQSIKSLKHCPKSQQTLLQTILRKGQFSDALQRVISNKSSTLLNKIGRQQQNNQILHNNDSNIQNQKVPTEQYKFYQQQNEINSKMMRANKKENMSEALAIKTRKIMESEIALGQVKLIEQIKLKKMNSFGNIISRNRPKILGVQNKLNCSPNRRIYVLNADQTSPLKNLFLRETTTDLGIKNRYF